METAKLDPLAWGLSLAIVNTLCMLFLSAAGRGGHMSSAVWIAMNFVPGYSLKMIGILFGALECVIVSFLAGYLIAYLYNRFAQA